MIRFFQRPLAAAALLLALPSLAPAATTHSTSYVYYTVSGRTPSEIYRSILSRGPRVGGQKAIAATAARGVQDFGLAQASSCQITDYRLNFRFRVQLPRPASTSALSSRDRALWQQFSVFLKAHEMEHIKLWLGCATDLERKVTSIDASSCKDARRQAEALWRKMKTSCDKLQVSFDKEQRSELLAQPFMQRVIRGY